MARGIRAGFSISDLEQLLNDQRSAHQKLLKQKDELQKKLELIDRDIAKLSGGSVSSNGTSRRTGVRAKNSMSLVEALEVALKGRDAMAVGDILEAVKSTGYQSSSANFRGIINQTLIKDKRFTSSSRGMYQLKK